MSAETSEAMRSGYRTRGVSMRSDAARAASVRGRGSVCRQPRPQLLDADDRYDPRWLTPCPSSRDGRTRTRTRSRKAQVHERKAVVDAVAVANPPC